MLGWADSTADGGREEVERMNVNENRKRGLHRLSAVILINTSNEIYQSISSFFTFCIPYAAPRLHVSVSFYFSLFFHVSFPLVAGEIDSSIVRFLESQSRVVIPESTETNRHQWPSIPRSLCVMERI